VPDRDVIGSNRITISSLFWARSPGRGCVFVPLSTFPGRSLTAAFSRLSVRPSSLLLARARPP